MVKLSVAASVIAVAFLVGSGGSLAQSSGGGASTGGAASGPSAGSGLRFGAFDSGPSIRGRRAEPLSYPAPRTEGDTRKWSIGRSEEVG